MKVVQSFLGGQNAPYHLKKVRGEFWPEAPKPDSAPGAGPVCGRGGKLAPEGEEGAGQYVAILPLLLHTQYIIHQELIYVFKADGAQVSYLLMHPTKSWEKVA